MVDGWLGYRRLPVVRQDIIDAPCRMGRQSIQYVFEIGIRIMAIELGRLNEAHDRRRAFARPQ